MKIDRPEHYYKVSLERMRQAWFLFKDKEGLSYSLAMYAAGVAVESMLRAFKMLRDPTFDEKHDLRLLFKASGMLSLDQERLRSKGLNGDQAREHFRNLQAAVTDVSELWANGYRFASEDRMRAHLKTKKLDRGLKGDFLKAQAKLLLEASQTVIDKGVFQWNLLKKSGTS